MAVEVSNESWFSRIKNSCMGVVIGIVMFVVALGVLFWNEKRTVDRENVILVTERDVVELASTTEVNSANEGKPVFLSGDAKTEDTLVDDKFGVTAEKKIKLRRIAEMYQWVEHKDTKKEKKVGGGERTVTTYSYTQEWRSGRLDTNSFHDGSRDEYGDNPQLRFNNEEKTAKEVNVDAFTLNGTLINMINVNEKVDNSTATLAGISPELKSVVRVESDWIYLPFNVPAADPNADPNDPNADPNDPNATPSPAPPANTGGDQIGDQRVRFEIVPTSTVSLVAAQAGSSFKAYEPPGANGSFIELMVGKHDSKAIFNKARSENTFTAWLFRIGGTIASCIGVGLVLRPAQVLADVIPFIGNIVGGGVFLISLAVGVLASTVTICIAWLVFHPIWAITVMVIVAGIVFGIVYLVRSMSSKSAA